MDAIGRGAYNKVGVERLYVFVAVLPQGTCTTATEGCTGQRDSGRTQVQRLTLPQLDVDRQPVGDVPAPVPLDLRPAYRYPRRSTCPSGVTVTSAAIAAARLIRCQEPSGPVSSSGIPAGPAVSRRISALCG